MEYVRIMLLARLSMEGIALGSVAKLYYVGGGGGWGGVGYWLKVLEGCRWGKWHRM